MESHPTLEELYARPARKRRERPWNIFSGILLIVFAIAFWLLPIFVTLPDWVLVLWAILFGVGCFLMVLLLRRLERWYWAQSWAWKEQ